MNCMPKSGKTSDRADASGFECVSAGCFNVTPTHGGHVDELIRIARHVNTGTTVNNPWGRKRIEGFFEFFGGLVLRTALFS